MKSFNLREKNKRHRRFLKNENQAGCLKVGSSVIPWNKKLILIYILYSYQ